MSERRKIDVGALDLSLLEETAKAKGFSILHNTTVDGYNASPVRDSKCELVLKNDDRYDLGFRQKTDGSYEMVYDDWQGTAEKKLYDVMSSYKERLIVRRAPLAGFRVTGRTETDTHITLTVARGRA